MTQRVVKINETNYRWLVSLAGDMQKASQERVSVDDAIASLRKKKLSKFSGVLKISEKEASEILENIRKGWKNWKSASV